MIYIFAGPTLSAQEGKKILNAIYLPPASHGDLYRIALKRPTAIGIIDGYFEKVPAIWHKEILWAMEQGIHVYGSASMGALRAAELYQFGMIGIGEIFEQYRDGSLEDDDEVVLVHGQGDVDFVACSEPMVNIRRTFIEAEKQDIISRSTHAALIDIAKNLFYPARLYPTILLQAEKSPLPAEEILHLKNWLPFNKYNQKKEDACLMLENMNANLKEINVPKKVTYKLENTEWWESLKRRAGTYTISETATKSVQTELLLNELRIQGIFFNQLLTYTIFRCLANNEAVRLGWKFDNECLQKLTDEFRRRYGLFGQEEMKIWLKENELSEHDFIKLMESNAQIEFIINTMYPSFMVFFVDELRSRNLYQHYLSRALEKRTFLENMDFRFSQSFTEQDSARQILGWLFEKNKQTFPNDLERYAQSLGFSNGHSLELAAKSEYLFVQKNDN